LAVNIRIHFYRDFVSAYAHRFFLFLKPLAIIAGGRRQRAGGRGQEAGGKALLYLSSKD